MTHAGFVLAAWIVVAITLALYALRLVLRGRALTRSVEPHRRRWLESSAADAVTKERS